MNEGDNCADRGMACEALQRESHDGLTGQQPVLFGHPAAGALAPSARYDDRPNRTHSSSYAPLSCCHSRAIAPMPDLSSLRGRYSLQQAEYCTAALAMDRAMAKLWANGPPPTE